MSHSLQLTDSFLGRRFRYESRTALDISIGEQRLAVIERWRNRLLNHAECLIATPCPCGYFKGRKIASVDRYGLPVDSILCNSCGTVRLCPYLDDNALDEFYRNDYQLMYGRSIDKWEYFKRQSEYGVDLLEVLGEVELPCSHVLEIGCGAGGALNVLKSRGISVTGCDYSQELIDYGKSFGIEGLHFGSHEVFSSPEFSGRFDCVFLHHVFEHVQEPNLMLRELLRLVNPEQGRVVIVVPDIFGSLRSGSKDLMHFLHIGHKFNFSVGGLRQIARMNGANMRILVPPGSRAKWWSVIPELWVEFTVHSDGDVRQDDELPDDGGRCFRALVSDERSFRRGRLWQRLISRTKRVWSS